MFWKSYFWVISILMTLHHLAVYDLAGGFSRIWEVANITVDIVSMIGLFGFCWEKRIFYQLFWRIFLPVCIIWCVIYTNFIPELQEIAEITTPQIFDTFDMVFSHAIFILLIIALFLYAFKRRYIWE